mmetsp:Transcript_23493/g.35675  ORF Transcript_23493/g.35675 Transcript_23493/m.35675 type:complete len:147 (-) Transcript_23493:723-1163(-)
MLSLHLIMMRAGTCINVIWVAGKRMIDNGVDGCSRADYGVGIASATVHSLDFVPLHQTALDRNLALLQCNQWHWLQETFDQWDMKLLSRQIGILQLKGLRVSTCGSLPRQQLEQRWNSSLKVSKSDQIHITSGLHRQYGHPPGAKP